jgi:hypothetical protein
MADDKAVAKNATEVKGMGLEASVAILQKLGKSLGAAVKSRALGKPDFGKQIEEAYKLAGQFDWAALKATIETEAKAVREQQDANLQARREKLHHAAVTANVPASMGAQADRLDIFRIEYEGSVADISLGGATVERLKEVDGDKLFARIRHLRAILEKNPFLRDEFFRMLKAAHVSCLRSGTFSDGFVPIRELHREILFERARSSDRFRKNPDPRSIEPYPLHQFVFDLARFIRGGVAVGEERLATQTPSMRESKETIHIPNLENPMGSETAAARLAVKPA